MLEVTYRSRATGREWVECFDLGSVEANALHALTIAWKRNAAIVKSETH